MKKASIRSTELRQKLPPKNEPYWEKLYHGRAVGFRRGARSGAWIVRYRESGRYVQRSLGAESDLDYRQAVKAAMEAGKVRVQRYTVNDALNDYLDDYNARSGRDNTISYRIEKIIRPQLGLYRIERLTRKQINSWRNKLAGRPRDPEVARKRKVTANKFLTILKAALNHAFEQGHVHSDDPWRQVRLFQKVDAPRIAFLTEAEIRRLINACDFDFRLLVQAALLTGCRYGEVIQMTAASFDNKAGTLHIPITKSGIPRDVPLTDEGIRFFESATVGLKRKGLIFIRRDGLPWGKSHQGRPMKLACERAKIDPPISFHILRHCYGASLAHAGVSLQVIAALLGHADTRITERHYAHLQPSHIAEQLRANLPEIGIKSDNIRKIG